MGDRQLGAGESDPAGVPAHAQNEFIPPQPAAILELDGVRVEEAGRAGCIEHPHPRAAQVLEQLLLLMHLVNHLLGARH